ncbi:MAG: ADP-forming succinate--CoA ligase subunit beta [Acidimicrobiia bacterium]|nr:ADP-forming succinate--CoA ligase subunit beta [Acidimicrobiia bacterium]MBT8216364.1 ADP-forming succinate--CoA ligase subunit beta [Acidimicrobiia bacterium]NNF11018.1 ADP-forming succinate--CoA ligase subunit beta [Acidimicrobiia bacterium]NNL69703.1 ADP-forming succinate--CoA ligase subunit beta [Acidimicrobiia bacterium]
MDLFEYQGKSLFARLGVPVPDGRLATSPSFAAAAANELGGSVVVKAQVQVGGRGKAGGIKLAHSASEAEEAASQILGMDIKGHTVHSVWVEEASDIAAEYYASFTLDRSAKKHLAMVSAQGGVDIEGVAESDPDAVVKLHIDPVVGLTDWQARELVYRAKLDPSAARKAAGALKKLYAAFVGLDCDLVEVNPLILTGGGDIVALDAKVTLDANAFYRHPDFGDFEAAFTRDPIEARAMESDLNFIKLDGSVGIIGNGAGLVMSTLDVVDLVGGRAANFLDVGGGAGADTITNALEVLTQDDSVKSVLINIFGGITRCDLVAEGIIEALGRLELPWPIVVRLDGTNAEEGRAILAGSPNEKLIAAATMREAAEKAVELAGGA